MIKEIEFINNSIDQLQEKTPKLMEISEFIKHYLKYILNSETENAVNVTSRIKSENSLKEKIIRNRFLNHYNSPEELIDKLTDLIGLRIECRFIQDEEKIYNLLKKHFNTTDDGVLYYSEDKPNIRLDLAKKQPVLQKNGFEIFKMKGVYLEVDKEYYFELQVKSLVNVFWSEIEHRIIYKNNTYLLADKFLEEMMQSINFNLRLIDQQLMSIYSNFKPEINTSEDDQLEDLKNLFAKFLYDAVAAKMKQNLGFIVDFKKACETIVDYSFTRAEEEITSLSGVTNLEFTRIGDLFKKDINFRSKIVFDSEPVLEEGFCQDLAYIFEKRMNYEFPWNLFFRILFELEPYENYKDFENFIEFYKASMIDEKLIIYADRKYGENADLIINDIYDIILSVIEVKDTVEVFYINKIKKMREANSSVLDYILYQFDSYEHYFMERNNILKMLYSRLESIFNS